MGIVYYAQRTVSGTGCLGKTFALASALLSRMGRSGPHHRDQPMRGPPPGDGAIRMRHRYPCHPKFPSSSPVWVRQLLYRLVPLGL